MPVVKRRKKAKKENKLASAWGHGLFFINLWRNWQKIANRVWKVHNLTLKGAK